MSIHNNYIAIMAGGIGSRFWPESRQNKPKQFLDILGMGKSLLQLTYQRFSHICPKENIYIITHHSYIPIILEQIPDIDKANIVGEPSRKNTAPAAAYISFKIQAKNPNANIVLAPADHMIADERLFESTVFKALDFVAHHKALITLGIKPTRPDTGYGYIQYNSDDKNELEAIKVKTFTEKPNLEIARTFLKSGDFLWNSGIFVWNAQVFLNELKTYLPQLYDIFYQANTVFNTSKENEIIEKLYMQCTNISIDYGVMEKATNVYVLPSSFGWSDLGTWESAYDQSKKDYLDNAVYGKNIVIIDSNGCMVKAPDKKLVILQGLEEYIVIDTEDVLLICERSNEQEIKEYVAEVKRNKGEKFL